MQTAEEIKNTVVLRQDLFVTQDVTDLFGIEKNCSITNNFNDNACNCHAYKFKSEFDNVLESLVLMSIKKYFFIEQPLMHFTILFLKKVIFFIVLFMQLKICLEKNIFVNMNGFFTRIVRM